MATIAQLIRLLASDKEGERNNALDALHRKKVDFHDLADKVDAPAPVKSTVRPPPGRPPAGGFTGDLNHKMMATYLLAFTYIMIPKDEDFVKSMDRVLRAGYTATPKQIYWLEDLYRRYGGK